MAKRKYKRLHYEDRQTIEARVQIHTRYGDRQERCEASPPCSK